MDYNTLRKTVIHSYGEHNSSMVCYLFEQAVELANNGQLDEASMVCRDTLVFWKYSKVGYEIIYLLGLLCTIYLNNDQLNMAEQIFKTGVGFIQDSRDMRIDSDGFDEDINAFLDLKIDIDNAVKVKTSSCKD